MRHLIEINSVDRFRKGRKAAGRWLRRNRRLVFGGEDNDWNKIGTTIILLESIGTSL